MAKPRGIASLISKASPRHDAPADEPAAELVEAEPQAPTQGRGPKPPTARPRKKRKRDPESRELKLLGVPNDLMTRLVLHANFTGTSLSAAAIAVLDAGLPRFSIRALGRKSDPQTSEALPMAAPDSVEEEAA